jgi:hypothetical protein
VTDHAQINALAASLRRLPAPARKEWATELYELGFRFHPELATKKLVREGPQWMGNHAPTRIQPVDVDVDQVLAQMSKVAPGVAAQVRAVKDDEAAREAARAEYGSKLPPELKDVVDTYVAAKRAREC